jgi:hypothetical protein
MRNGNALDHTVKGVKITNQIFRIRPICTGATVTTDTLLLERLSAVKDGSLLNHRLTITPQVGN